ncbi:MAG TPA: hypothetical protein VF508_07625, partial [Pyrinomonadaceae bacterium]
MKTYKTLAAVALCAVLCSAATASGKGTQSMRRFLFDDFSYTTRRALERNGWIVRTAPGWPGVPGATWWPEGVTFVKDGARGGRVLRMTSRTDGTGAGTRQTQV